MGNLNGSPQLLDDVDFEKMDDLEKLNFLKKVIISSNLLLGTKFGDNILKINDNPEDTAEERAISSAIKDIYYSGNLIDFKLIMERSDIKKIAIKKSKELFYQKLERDISVSEKTKLKRDLNKVTTFEEFMLLSEHWNDIILKK